MITIKDVAKKAGVSISTVSNVINGKGAIGTEKYKRVKAAMEELDYHPSFIAQNLRNNRSHLIGVIYRRWTSLTAVCSKGSTRDSTAMDIFPLSS